MSKIRKSIRPDLVNLASEKNKSNYSLIKAFVFTVSLFGLILALLGYGYQLGIASTFGYSPVEIVDNTSDFIYDSSVPVLKIATKVLKLHFWTDWFLSSSMISMVVILTFAGLIILILVRYFRGTPERHHATIKWLDSAESSIPYLQRAVFHDGPIKGFVRVILITPTYFYIGWFFMFIGLYLAVSTILMVPMLGYEEGRKVAKDFIIGAESCSPHDLEGVAPEKGKSKKIENRAQCVKVMYGENEVVRGRVIATNSRKIYLYVKDFRINDKGEKEAIRIPKSYPVLNAIIEKVDTEIKPEPKKNQVKK